MGVPRTASPGQKRTAPASPRTTAARRLIRLIAGISASCATTRRPSFRTTPTRSCGARSRPCSSRGIRRAPFPTAPCIAIPIIGARRSTCRPWCSATWAWIARPGWPSRATRRRARSASSASTWSTRRVKTWWRALAPRFPSAAPRKAWKRACRPRTASWSTWPTNWSTTSATCKTSSSPSNRVVCGCCRRATPNARAGPRCGSRSTWWRKV